MKGLSGGRVLETVPRPNPTVNVVPDTPSQMCTLRNGNRDNDELPYWDRVAQCTPCTSLPQCGFCMSSLQCLHGDSLGPVGEAPCPGGSDAWIFSSISPVSGTASCPVAPPCEQEATCLSCVRQDECVWCANSTDGGGNCMDVSKVFSSAAVCRAAVFDEPCPASFVSESTVIGNVIVAPDDVFGGGHLDVNAGVVAVNDTLVRVSSLNGETNIQGGNTSDKNSQGGSVSINSGNGINPNRGRGGPIKFIGGNGAVLIGNSGHGGHGGHIKLSGGSSEIYDNRDSGRNGGKIKIQGGISLNSTGGRIMLATMRLNARLRASAAIRITVLSGNSTGGNLVVETGASTANASSFTGDISLRTGDGVPSSDFTNSGMAGAGNVQLSAGSSTEATGGKVVFRGGRALSLPTTGASVGSGGRIRIRSGASLGGSAGSSGSVTIRSADQNTVVQSTSGGIAVTTGATVSQKPGRVLLRAGPTYGTQASAGSVNVRAGNGNSSSSAGSINVTAGNANARGGSLNLVFQFLWGKYARLIPDAPN